MPLYEHEKQPRKAKGFWGKVSNLLSANPSAPAKKTDHHKFVDQRSLQALQASQPKKHVGVDKKRGDRTGPAPTAARNPKSGPRPHEGSSRHAPQAGKKDKAAGLRNPEVRREVADFLSTGAHYGPVHTNSKKAAAQEEALRKLTAKAAPQPTLRQKVRDDYKHYPTPNEGPHLKQDVETYMRQQGIQQDSSAKAPAGQPPPIQKPAKAELRMPFQQQPTKNNRTAPKHQPGNVRQEAKKQLPKPSRSGPQRNNAKAAAETDRTTKWEDFYGGRRSSPTVPGFPPTTPNAARVHNHRAELEKHKKGLPRCQLCGQESIYNQQLATLGYNLCEACTRSAFYHPSTSPSPPSAKRRERTSPVSPLTPSPRKTHGFAFNYQHAQGHYSPDNTVSPIQPQRHQAKGKQKAPTTTSPWIEELKPSPEKKPSLHRAPLQTYSSIFELQKAQAQAQTAPPPPVPPLPPTIRKPAPKAQEIRDLTHPHQQRPSSSHSSHFSAALPPGTLPPNTIRSPSPHYSAFLPPGTLPPSSIQPSKTQIPTSTALPPPSLPPIGPPPQIPEYEPISWRSGKNKAKGEEQEARDSGFYDFWGEVLTYQSKGPEGSGERRYQQA